MNFFRHLLTFLFLFLVHHCIVTELKRTRTISSFIPFCSSGKDILQIWTNFALSMQYRQKCVAVLCQLGLHLYLYVFPAGEVLSTLYASKTLYTLWDVVAIARIKTLQEGKCIKYFKNKQMHVYIHVYVHVIYGTNMLDKVHVQV